jgi:Kef-type K+ transport system membrane component KefB/nucleotide-binding universal stress UspA family protein
LHAGLAPEGVDVVPFALFVGVAMSVTAFPVLARILTERQLIRTRLGAIALAAAAVDDVTAWCLLAVVVGIAGSGGVGAAAITTALAATYSAAVWLYVRPVLRRIGPRSGQAVSTDVIAVVLLLLIASACITEWIGIHALFGAFLLGAAMPREGGLTGVITEKLEDFTTIVLLPLFFAWSGLRTQIGLLSDANDWLLCLLIIAVASLGKFGGTAVAGRLTGLGFRDAAALGVLMNTRGLMEIVVLNVGLDLGVISPRLFAMMVLMALATTWMTSPILARLYPPSLLADPDERATPEVPVAERQGVLLCISDPQLAGALVRLGQRWRAGGGGRVWVVHLRPTDRPRDYLRGDKGEEPLEAVRRCADAVGLEYEPISFPSADPAEDIVRVASLKQAALVVVGVHRSSLGRDSLGGVVGRVLAACQGDAAALVDGGEGPLDRVATVGGIAAGRVGERLIAGGAVASAPGDADLVVDAFNPSADLRASAGRSLLLVRGAV